MQRAKENLFWGIRRLFSLRVQRDRAQSTLIILLCVLMSQLGLFIKTGGRTERTNRRTASRCSVMRMVFARSHVHVASLFFHRTINWIISTRSCNNLYNYCVILSLSACFVDLSRSDNICGVPNFFGDWSALRAARCYFFVKWARQLRKSCPHQVPLMPILLTITSDWTSTYIILAWLHNLLWRYKYNYIHTKTLWQ